MRRERESVCMCMWTFVPPKFPDERAHDLNDEERNRMNPPPLKTAGDPTTPSTHTTLFKPSNADPTLRPCTIVWPREPSLLMGLGFVWAALVLTVLAVRCVG